MELQRIRPWLLAAEADAVLPVISAGDLEAAAKKFKADTGLGADRIHPRVYADATPGVQVAIVRLLAVAEEYLCWPQQIQLLSCALLA